MDTAASLPDLSDLTEDQEDALRTILNRIHNGYDHTKLNGRAGVGKTYVTTRLVKCLLAVDAGEVVVAAPTHEAKNQLRNALPRDVAGRVELSTLHSALDLTMRWSQDRKVLTKKSPWEPMQPDVLVVDEASMIGEQLAEHEADMHASEMSTVWIGDDGQLPPVNQSSAGVLDYPGPTLNEIVRQAKGSPVIEMASEIRDGCDGWIEGVLDHVDGNEVRAVPKADAASLVADRFENAKGLYDARVLAFRNDVVGEWNRAVSDRLFPDADHWEEGMRAMARETWLGPEDRLGPLHTSEMYEVVRAEPGMEDVGSVGPIGGVRLKTWELELQPAHRHGTVTARVVDPASEADYEDEKERRLELCRKGQMEWQAFYGMVEDVADVDYGYASTVHKCVPEDALVQTEEGMRKMQELREGDRVWTDENELKPVVDTADTGQKYVFEVESDTGHVLKASGDHRVLTQRGWVRVKNLDASEDQIALSRRTNPNVPDEDDFGYLLGYLVGDGSYSGDNYRVDIGMAKDSPLKEVLKSLLDRFSANGTPGENPKQAQNSLSLYCEDKNLRKRMLARGMERKKSPDKKPPELQSRAEERSYLRGLFDADGSASGSRAVVRLVSTSEPIIRHANVVLGSFGVIGNVRKRVTGNGYESWVLRVSGPSYRAFAENVGFRHPRKQTLMESQLHKVRGKSNVDRVPNRKEIADAVEEAMPKYQYGPDERIDWDGESGSLKPYLQHGFVTWNGLEVLVDHMESRKDIDVPQEAKKALEDHHYWDPIKNVENTGERTSMIDVEVEGDHSFVCRNAIVHNSQGATITDVFCDYGDLVTAPGGEYQIQPLAYVAVTRAADSFTFIV